MVVLRLFVAAVALTGFAPVTSSFAENSPAPPDRPYAALEVWDFDSVNPVHPAQTPDQVAAQEVAAIMERMVEQWNAHDLDGYLDAFWRSPALFLVEDGSVINGWQDLHDHYHRGFYNPNAMGRGTLTRIQVRMLDPNTAAVLEHWTIAFEGVHHTVAGVDSGILKRMDGAWRIVIMHSSTIDM